LRIGKLYSNNPVLSKAAAASYQPPAALKGYLPLQVRHSSALQTSLVKSFHRNSFESTNPGTF
jgi:hypothetical protein